VVLSREEVQRLFAVVKNLKHRALLMVADDAGLRLSEVLNLRIEDVDGQRMAIRIRQGQGKKDRYARLTPGLWELLREYRREFRPQTFLFPGASSASATTASWPTGTATNDLRSAEISWALCLGRRQRSKRLKRLRKTLTRPFHQRPARLVVAKVWQSSKSYPRHVPFRHDVLTF
jgi:integrase